MHNIIKLEVRNNIDCEIMQKRGIGNIDELSKWFFVHHRSKVSYNQEVKERLE